MIKHIVHEVIVTKLMKTSKFQAYFEDGACTDHPKSASFISPSYVSNKFSGLMSL